MGTSFSGGGSRSTWREPPTLGKQLVSFITCDCRSSAVIEQRKHLRKKWKIHCYLRYGGFLTVNQIVMTKVDFFSDLFNLGVRESWQRKMKKKLYDFTFPRVNCPFISSNIPASPVYGVHISHLIRYCRACAQYSEFLNRSPMLTQKLLKQNEGTVDSWKSEVVEFFFHLPLSSISRWRSS
jgi:hypothetical protein